MTTPNNHNDARDEVLYAFHQAYERPTADEITEWIRRYPQFAEDIRAHAAVARDWAAPKTVPVERPDEAMLARGYSRVLNALYNAEVATAAEAPQPCESFHRLITAHGTDIPRLARELDIGRSVLADLVNGGMLAPVGKRLVNAITGSLRITVAAFDSALQLALNAPRLGHAKADGTPTVIPRSYEEIVRTSNMTPERVQYWLSQD